ncbi:MAG: ferrous iron transport protein A [Endomicrobium sp.]|jgi:Fe2+ transport system protein FeoA|nr:ferrous iron transport protein A [Endomicrobium sp.]
MAISKRVIRCFCENLRKRWIKTHLKKFKNFDNRHERHKLNNCQECHNMVKLSNAVAGTYRFVTAHCDAKLRHRLLEIGFVPSEKLIVIEKTGNKSNVVIRIKGSKIALSNKVADRVLLERK